MTDLMEVKGIVSKLKCNTNTMDIISPGVKYMLLFLRSMLLKTSDTSLAQYCMSPYDSKTDF